MTIPYEAFLEDVQRRRRERWAAILAREDRGRVPGCRPRDPEQERLLLRLDRARLARLREHGELSLSMDREAPEGLQDMT